jgi:hypothetical protein
MHGATKKATTSLLSTLHRLQRIDINVPPDILLQRARGVGSYAKQKVGLL